MYKLKDFMNFVGELNDSSLANTKYQYIYQHIYQIPNTFTNTFTNTQIPIHLPTHSMDDNVHSSIWS